MFLSTCTCGTDMKGIKAPALLQHGLLSSDVLSCCKACNFNGSLSPTTDLPLLPCPPWLLLPENMDDTHA